MLINKKEYKDDDGKVGYIESIFDSTNVLKSIYFPKKHMLYISFNRGLTYSYSRVDETLYKEFEESESQGKFFNEKFKNNDKHPYSKEFSLTPSELNEIKTLITENKNSDEKKG